VNTVATFAAVALGGALGAAARHAVAVALTAWWPHAGALATMTVNVTGTLILAWLAAGWASADAPQATRLFFATGVLGAFTTYSTFALDGLRLVQAGRLGAAAAYVLLTLTLGGLAALAGWRLGS
jgi:CrcB protein